MQESLKQFKERIKGMPFLDAVKVEPHPDIIKELPDKRVDSNGKFVAVRYIPIENVQMLLELICTNYDVQIISQGSMFSSVFVTKRLVVYVEDCYSANGLRRISVDGVGAMAVNNLNPVRMMLPAASSLAETNAAKNLGVLFGRDLNRGLSDEVTQDAELTLPKSESVKVVRIKKLIESCKNIDELKKLKASSKPEFETYFTEKENEFRSK